MRRFRGQRVRDEASVLGLREEAVQAVGLECGSKLHLEDRGDLDGAEAAYRVGVERGSPHAANNLRLLLHRRQSVAQKAMLQAAEERGIPVVKVDDQWALINSLAAELHRQGKPAEAETMFRQVLESGSPEAAASAAYNLGLLCEKRGERAQARTYYAWVLEHGDATLRAFAGLNYGVQLMAEGRFRESVPLFERVIDSGDAEAAPRAAHSLGIVLIRESKFAEAMVALQKAVDSGHPDEAPGALLRIGALLFKQGRRLEAENAFRRVIASRHPEFGPSAEECLQQLLDERRGS